MAGKARTGAALAICVAVAGCGGGGSSSKSSTPKAGLPQPVHPRCGVEDFGKAIVTELTSKETRGRSWSLQYARRKAARAGDLRTVLVVEVSPQSPLPKRQPGVTDSLIAGRRVALRSPGPKSVAFTAQWRTSRALYTMIAAGRDAGAVRRLIGCFP